MEVIQLYLLGWTLGGSIYKKSGNAWQQVSSTVLDATITKE